MGQSDCTARFFKKHRKKSKTKINIATLIFNGYEAGSFTKFIQTYCACDCAKLRKREKEQ